jgi:hypothetical protein
MLVREIIAVYSEKFKHEGKPIYKLSGQNAIIIKAGGTYSYHQALKA